MPEKDKKLLQRYGHGAAGVTVHSNCVEVILFGGQKKGLPIADPVVLRFGEYDSMLFVICYEKNNLLKFIKMWYNLIKLL